MKEIMIRIKGRQITREAGEDEIEFVTEGKLYQRNGTIYLLYEESEFSGVPGCQTRLRLRDGEIVRDEQNEERKSVMEIEW